MLLKELNSSESKGSSRRKQIKNKNINKINYERKYGEAEFAAIYLDGLGVH